PVVDRRSGLPLGTVITSTVEQVDHAFEVAKNTQIPPPEVRIEVLEKAVEVFRLLRMRLMALLASESGYDLSEALAEIRATTAFCRNLAALARQYLLMPEKLVGPTGESNTVSFAGRGIIGCLSGTHSPLLEFAGQVMAAWVAGNCVVAKPSMRSPLVGSLAARIFHGAGIPPSALALVLGPREPIGDRIIRHSDCGGVAFSGLDENAQVINRVLAAREGIIVPLVTGLSAQAPYLLRFTTERTFTVNTAAAGGNTSLMTTEE
ncbi:MAG TPA: aldehyde dehydrogenase family protein, partial [Usitatibacter sp.]|nr:aldehyde dehydrogenase family protein [Usitatibacter sp.]